MEKKMTYSTSLSIFVKQIKWISIRCLDQILARPLISHWVTVLLGISNSFFGENGDSLEKAQLKNLILNNIRITKSKWHEINAIKKILHHQIKQKYADNSGFLDLFKPVFIVSCCLHSIT